MRCAMNEQHWMTELSEGLLYLHCRGATTVFDDLLHRFFDDSLTAHVPHRVLPLSAEPPRDIQLLLDEEFSQIAGLLSPGTRKRSDARARIRALLAIEAHVRETAVVSKKDVDRVERAIRAQGTREQIFPSLSEIATDVAGEGLTVKVRFVKQGGLPVKFVGASDDVVAGAIRELDLQKKYHWNKPDLAAKLNLSLPKSAALRWYLGVDTDDTCRHDFVFQSQTHRQYSDNAYGRMRTALEDGVVVNDVWDAYRAAGYGKGPPPSAFSEAS
jgi:hypothetical protein